MLLGTRERAPWSSGDECLRRWSSLGEPTKPGSRNDRFSRQTMARRSSETWRHRVAQRPGLMGLGRVDARVGDGAFPRRRPEDGAGTAGRQAERVPRDAPAGPVGKRTYVRYALQGERRSSLVPRVRSGTGPGHGAGIPDTGPPGVAPARVRDPARQPGRHRGQRWDHPGALPHGRAGGPGLVGGGGGDAGSGYRGCRRCGDGPRPGRPRPTTRSCLASRGGRPSRFSRPGGGRGSGALPAR